MKGYKAFGKGLICRGKQYAENTVFEEPMAKICRCGMHFCRNPFDVLNYYDLIDARGNVVEVAEVESLVEPVTEDEIKYCTTKLKVGRKISLNTFIADCIDYTINQSKGKEDNPSDLPIKVATSDDEYIKSDEHLERIVSAYDNTTIVSCDSANLIAAIGNCNEVNSYQCDAKILVSGEDCTILSSGDDAEIALACRASVISSTGINAFICSTGGKNSISSSGARAYIFSHGSCASISSSGDNAIIEVFGEKSTVSATGCNSRVKAVVGTYITLVEHEPWDGEYYPVKCVKTEFVDGVRIKADTWYRLKNGEFEEV